MNFLLLSSLLSVVTSVSVSLETQHKDLNVAIADLSPPEVKKSIDDFKYLVGLGEDSRKMAIKNLTKRQNYFDNSYAEWKKAYDALQVALGNQKEAEEAEVKATQARDDAIAFRDQKINEKNAADALVPPAEAWMNEEISRVASEDEALRKVKDILEKLIAGESLVQNSVNQGRSLLGVRRRTVTLLTAPSFISSLANASPERVQEVLDIVMNLIKEGQEAEEDATNKYNARVAEAATAKQNLENAETELDLRRKELSNAIDHKNEMIQNAKNAADHEKKMREIRDEMKNLLDIQRDFTDREIKRIDFEKEILLEAINLQTQLHSVTQLLA